MRTPVFIDLEQILGIYAVQVAFFGGAYGIRDAGLLESAVVAPINFFSYSNQKNLFEIAASYTFHITKNHPFVDGNKRVVYHSAIAFLNVNGIMIEADLDAIYGDVMKLTTSQIDQHDFALILSENAPTGAAILANLYLD